MKKKANASLDKISINVKTGFRVLLNAAFSYLLCLLQVGCYYENISYSSMYLLLLYGSSCSHGHRLDSWA